jgi:UDP-3-O-[3-hydroxymyristoyl] glucosamine N-acyltransferase
MKSFSIEEISQAVAGTLVGATAQRITGLEHIESATREQITFIGNVKYLSLWEGSNACVALISKNFVLEPGEGRALIRVEDADLAMARLLELFQLDPPLLDEGIHPTAVVHSSATIGKQARIGAHCYIGKNVVIGERVRVYPNVSIFDETTIGADTVIWSSTVIRERSIIGERCIFHANVSIGADGFGFRSGQDGKSIVKIPQIGSVIIGNDVEIGSGSCVDRGKFSATIIGDHCKIDNLVQIAHNCKLGRCCIMAGKSGLAGSVTLGDGVMIAGSVSVKDHVKIGDGAVIGGASVVIADVPAGKKMLGYPALNYNDTLKHWAMVRRLIRRS